MNSRPTCMDLSFSKKLRFAILMLCTVVGSSFALGQQSHKSHGIHHRPVNPVRAGSSKAERYQHDVKLKQSRFNHRTSLKRGRYQHDVKLKQSRFNHRTSLKRGRYQHDAKLKQARYNHLTSLKHGRYLHDLKLRQSRIKNVKDVDGGGNRHRLHGRHHH